MRCITGKVKAISGKRETDRDNINGKSQPYKRKRWTERDKISGKSEKDQRKGQFGPQKDKDHFMKSGTMSDAVPAERVKYVSNKRRYTCSQSRIQ
jgi:hypothetical protein